MNIADIIRAWQDREYRESLSDEERAKLPENPVGQIELTEDELTEVFGGHTGANGGCHGNTQSTACGQSTCSDCHGYTFNPHCG